MAFSKDNTLKSTSGQKVKELLKHTLVSLEQTDYCNITCKPYAIGYPKQDKQFKMDYQIIFHDFDDEVWLIKGTNSIRERIYGTEFFSQNIRIIDKQVSNIFVVVPDSISNKEMIKAKNYSKKIHSNRYTSFITDIITVNQLRQKIISKCTSIISQGYRSNLLGSNSEKDIATLLNDSKNLTLWNDFALANIQIKSSTYSQFKIIMEKLNLVEGVDQLVSVEATTEIPKLMNGGNPKTDVLVNIKTTSDSIGTTMSIKNSKSKVVTIHEGDIYDLIQALNLQNDSPLAIGLSHFQEVGSVKALKEKYPESFDILNHQLYLFNQDLVGFFIFGERSPLITNDIQIANMIVYTHKFEVFYADEYKILYLENFKEKGQLGTPFKWTYPSKKRGRKIQIKGFTNNQ